MARRAGLFGASDAERESRATQQRDYAAQLQEQVRIKHAQAEQEKARRRDEQQRERELLDALAQSTSSQQQPQARRAPLALETDASPPQQHQQQQHQQHQQQQQQQQQQHTAAMSPARSPQRYQQPSPRHAQQQAPPWMYPQSNDIQHGSSMLASSPPKLSAFGGGTMAMAATTPASYGSAAMLSPLVTTFVPGPSIFDSFFQSDSGVELTNQIQSLQSLRLEVEASWKQRRAALQTIATKPNFIVTPSPRASASIPLSLDDKRQLDQEIDLLSSRPEEEEEEEPELMSNTSGLLGESVLIPLAQVSPTKRTDIQSTSPRRLVPSSPPRSNSAVHRRLAAATAAAAASSNVETTMALAAMPSGALRHDSELLHFDQ